MHSLLVESANSSVAATFPDVETDGFPPAPVVVRSREAERPEGCA